MEETKRKEEALENSNVQLGKELSALKASQVQLTEQLSSTKAVVSMHLFKRLNDKHSLISYFEKFVVLNVECFSWLITFDEAI